MKRSAFKRKAPAAPQAPDRETRLEERAARALAQLMPKATVAICRAAMTDALRTGTGIAFVSIPKGPPAKPGKRTPTAEERAWMDAIVEHGCICCILDGNPPRPAAVHHILRGGQRMGHLYTIPLCDPGHHQGGQPLGLISRHPWKARFEEKYGTELELLELVKKRLAQRI